MIGIWEGVENEILVGEEENQPILHSFKDLPHVCATIGDCDKFNEGSNVPK